MKCARSISSNLDLADRWWWWWVDWGVDAEIDKEREAVKLTKNLRRVREVESRS